MVTATLPQQTPILPDTDDLGKMVGRPFGLGEDGQPIDHGSGKLVLSAVRHMQHHVGQRVEREASAGLDREEIRKLAAQAESAALDQLVDMLNAAIDDERYCVTRDYLLKETNKYSYEFRLFVSDYCGALAGEPRIR